MRKGEAQPYNSLTWLGIYRLNITLAMNLLKTLRYSFLQEALNFIGVHQERMNQVSIQGWIQEFYVRGLFCISWLSFDRGISTVSTSLILSKTKV